MKDITAIKIGILGSARSGIAAAYKIKELGGNPFLSEFKKASEIKISPDISQNFECEFGGHTDKLLSCGLIIVSPGIPLNIPILIKAKEQNIKLISEIEFGYLIKEKKSKIIAVTGSNGKSTTVSLIHHILQNAGYQTILAGNIGDAFTSFPIEKPGIDYIILELSSFQLELIDRFKPDIAAVLNISPDHLDRYKNLEEYASVKFSIFSNQTDNDIAILNKDDRFSGKFVDQIISQIKQFSLTQKADIFLQNGSINWHNELIDLAGISLKGPHNSANIMAAILAVADLNIPLALIKKSLQTFQPLKHRLEFVDTVKQVEFYNDSKATNTDAVNYALRAFNGSVRLIIGGAGKGEDYTILTPEIKRAVKKTYLIGEERFKLQSAFADHISNQLYESFEEAIRTAFAEAESGDKILLAPACTSYDMFNNFEERGDKFKQIVEEIIKDEN